MEFYFSEKNEDMNVITLQNKKYPKLLKKIGKDAPKQLYYKGVWPFDTAQGKDDIFENCLAVVGSRQMTTYGRQVVEKIVGEVAAAGITIVSGFMYGIDATAHKAALRVGGRTIAVMPCGIDMIHPEYQQDLYAEILKNKGLIISEYEGSFAPTLWTYPQRNRIVAGLSKASLIIEAGEKSGSLITANLAKKYKRKVFVVPGPITSENSKGIMQLMKEGAEAISSARDILKFYGSHSEFFERFTLSLSGSDATQKIQNASLRCDPKNLKPSPESSLEQQIISQLRRETLDTDDLARILCVPAQKLGTTVSLMELKGIIKQEGGKWQSNLI